MSPYRKCTTRSSGSGNSRARRCVRTCVAVRSAPASSRRRRAGSCWRGRSTSGRSCGRREWTRRTMRRSGHCRCTAAPLPGSAALCGNLAPAQRCHRECLWESVHGADAADGGDLSSAGAERAGLPYRLSRGPSPRTSHPFIKKSFPDLRIPPPSGVPEEQIRIVRDLNGHVPPPPDHFCATTSRSVRCKLG